MDYRKIWIKANGLIPKDEQGRSYEIHHLDGNRRNNSLENLTCLSIEDHYRLHLEQGDKAAAYRIGQRMKLDPEYLRQLNREKELGRKHSKETCEKRSKSLTGRKRSEIEKASISKAKKGKSNGHEGLEHSEEWKRKQSESSKHKCRHTESGQVFGSVSEAAKFFNYPYGTFYLRFKTGEFTKVNS